MDVRERLRDAIKVHWRERSIRKFASEMEACDVEGKSRAMIHRYLLRDKDGNYIGPEPGVEFLIEAAAVTDVRPAWLLAEDGEPTEAEELIHAKQKTDEELLIEPLYVVGAPEEERTQQHARQFKREITKRFPHYFDLTATTQVDIQNLLARFVYQSSVTTPSTLPLRDRVNFVVRIGKDLIGPWEDRGRPWIFHSPEFSTYAKSRILSWLLLWAPVHGKEAIDG